MDEVFICITIGIATFGYLIWFALCASLKLPIRFQIMYDSNPPYVFRILNRRRIAIAIFGILPILLLRWMNVSNHFSWTEMGLSFNWNNLVSIWLAITIPAITFFHFRTANKTSNLEQFPEIRVRFWTPNILFWSATWWVVSLIAYEFFYRGLLFGSLRNITDNDWTAVLICAGLYAMAHSFKRNRISIAAVIYGVASCLIVVHTGSLIPVIIIQIVNALGNEWWSIYYHPEMHAQNT